jgi:cytochrome c553
MTSPKKNKGLRQCLDIDQYIYDLPVPISYLFQTMIRTSPRLLLAALALLACSTSTLSANELKGNPQAGESKIASCIGCHGIVGYQASFPEVYKVPKISHQNGAYIIAALNAYKSGERKHPTMRSVAQTLNDQDMADIAAYYEGHGQAVSVPEQPAAPSAKVSELLVKGGCNSCHGANYSTPIMPSYPKIAGQNRDYLFVALKSYKTDGNATWGRSNPVMGGIAKQFSNSELKEIANYIGSQPGQLLVVPQPKFR